jgi:6-hydroxycyclohex-1-ene-1-carbonyl-CoA dehydrogenase
MPVRHAWQLVSPGEPLRLVEGDARPPGPGDVLVRVAGCGVCHTDVSFLEGHVKPRAPLPIVLGHEVAGTVVEAGSGAERWLGTDVVVPAVIPCGACAWCRAGRGNVCTSQFMPGNDGDGGWATHVTVRAVGLCEVPPLPEGLTLADLSVVADAVSTPLQAVRRAGVRAGDLVVVVGAGGVGTHAVQVAAASGARVIALDVHPSRLEALAGHGAHATVRVAGLSVKDIREAVRARAKDLGASSSGWKVFECSGTPAGQETAYNLLTTAGTLAVVGFTRDVISLRLSNLMAFDATAFGSWGCPPELYPEAVELVRTGKVALRPFVRHVPLRDAPSLFDRNHAAGDARRPILIP